VRFWLAGVRQFLTDFANGQDAEKHTALPALARNSATAHRVFRELVLTGYWCLPDTLHRLISRRVLAPVRLKNDIQARNGRTVQPYFLQVPRFRWRCCRFRRRRLKSLPDNIFGILESAGLKTLINQRLDFGFGDLNSHGIGPFIIITRQQYTGRAVRAKEHRQGWQIFCILRQRKIRRRAVFSYCPINSGEEGQEETK